MLFYSSKLWGAFKLYATKRPYHTLRYQSTDGHVSYYQRNAGELVLSTKYEIQPIVAGKPNDHYFVVDSIYGENILIYQTNNFYNSMPFVPMGNIYYGKLGDKKIYPLSAPGYIPNLQLKDTWVSLYNGEEKAIHLKSLGNQEFDFIIKMNKKNKYLHIPNVAMLDVANVLFTDMNHERKMAIMKLNRYDKFIHPVYISEMDDTIQLCFREKILYAMVVGNNKTKIMEFKIDEKMNVSKAIVLYTSDKQDFATIECTTKENSIYFLKNIANPTTSEYYTMELTPYVLNTVTKELTSIEITSPVKIVPDSLFRMGASLFITSGDKYYVNE